MQLHAEEHIAVANFLQDEYRTVFLVLFEKSYTFIGPNSKASKVQSLKSNLISGHFSSNLTV